MTLKVKRILVSQPKPTSEKSPYFDLAEKYGVKVDFHQFIRIEPLTPKEFRLQHVNILDHTAVVFNSRHGVDHFFHLCQEMRLTIPDSMHYYCISEAIGFYLQKYIQYRKRKVYFPESGKLPDLMAQMLKKDKDEKYMLVMSDVNVEETVHQYAEHGLTVTPAILYRTVSNLFDPKKPFNYDMLVFFTPAGVHALKQNFPDFEQGETVIACLGESTAHAIEEAGLRLDIKAPTPQCPSITMAIDNFLKENHKRIRK